MKIFAFLFALIDGYKTYAAVILTIASCVGLISYRNYDDRISEIFQALTLVFAGATAVGLRHAVAKVPMNVIHEAFRDD
jgi:hypothetical protein